ncbi:MAG: PsiF family protein [Steroidobacteraceae bacterium]
MTSSRKYIVLIAAVTALGFVTVAPANNAQQQKMTMCNAQAKSKSLAGSARSEFMKSCLRKGGEHSHSMNSQQMKMKSCNADAKAKALKGAARRAFMSSCLKRS